MSRFTHGDPSIDDIKSAITRIDAKGGWFVKLHPNQFFDFREYLRFLRGGLTIYPFMSDVEPKTDSSSCITFGSTAGVEAYMRGFKLYEPTVSVSGLWFVTSILCPSGKPSDGKEPSWLTIGENSRELRERYFSWLFVNTISLAPEKEYDNNMGRTDKTSIRRAVDIILLSD